MKLLFCPQCQDIVRLVMRERRHCACGASSGQYLDNLNAVYSGPAIPLGFSNPSFRQALHHQPQEGLGYNFEAFVIPIICPTFVRDDPAAVTPAADSESKSPTPKPAQRTKPRTKGTDSVAVQPDSLGLPSTRKPRKAKSDTAPDSAS